MKQLYPTVKIIQNTLAYALILVPQYMYAIDGIWNTNKIHDHLYKYAHKQSLKI